MPIKYEQLTTPCYVIHEDILETTVHEFIDAINEVYPETIIAYSYKTNYHPYILEYMKRKGFFAEVTSEDEYNVAKQELKYDRSIVYNGPVKSKITFMESIKNNCFVNIDSHREISWLNELDTSKMYNVGIRINFDMEKYCSGETQLLEVSSRFGFCMENDELQKAIESIRKLNNIRVNCLHMHCGANTKSLKVYECIAEKACQVISKYELDVEYIDIGGGFKLGANKELNMKAYLKTIRNVIKNKYGFDNMKLLIEPGNSMVYPAIDYKTKVVDIKLTERNRFVILDGSRIHTEPMFRGRKYEVDIDRKSVNNNFLKQQMLVGCTCKESDRFLNIKDQDEICEGDFVTFNEVGAYSMSLAPTFIVTFPNVYIEREKQYYLYSKKKSYKTMK